MLFLAGISNSYQLEVYTQNCDDIFQATVADFKYGVNTDVNIGVSVSRGGNTLFEVM